MRFIKYILISLPLFACSTSPTGQSQLHLLPSSKVNELGRQSYEDLKKKTPISRNSRYVNITNCVVKALLDRNGFRSQEWEVNVFADPAVNAFALPGKKIGVYEGIFKAAANEDQLAAVLGHEIGHVIAEHGNARMSNQIGVSAATVLATVLLEKENKNSKNSQLLLAAIGMGAIILPYSRSHESEADEIGLEYMARAGFDPRQGVDLWQNMSKQGKAPPEILSTHPSSSTRIKDIRRLLPKMIALQDQALQKYPAPSCAY